MGDTVRLGAIAMQVRSKNAGPFWQTLDVFFADEASYQQVVASQAISRDGIARLYRVDPDNVLIFELPSLRVIKVSFPRAVAAGSFADRDLHAGQQHVPLACIEVPAGARS